MKSADCELKTLVGCIDLQALEFLDLKKPEKKQTKNHHYLRIMFRKATFNFFDLFVCSFISGDILAPLYPPVLRKAKQSKESSIALLRAVQLKKKKKSAVICSIAWRV